MYIVNKRKKKQRAASVIVKNNCEERKTAMTMKETENDMLNDLVELEDPISQCLLIVQMKSF